MLYHKNFRAYRKPQTFAFGTDVTVLYGANGFGKTSFRCRRFCGYRRNRPDQTPRRPTLQEDGSAISDSTPEESTVSLSFWCNGALRKIARSVSDRKRAIWTASASIGKEFSLNLRAATFQRLTELRILSACFEQHICSIRNNRNSPRISRTTAVFLPR